jgi:N-alpha-acetyltransferase 50
LTCRIEDIEGTKKLYILTLGVLEPYRKLGIGKRLVETAIAIGKETKVAESVFLHVHIENEGAMKFYENCGFEKGAYLENYYKDIENPHCFIFEKKLN